MESGCRPIERKSSGRMKAQFISGLRAVPRHSLWRGDQGGPSGGGVSIPVRDGRRGQCDIGKPIGTGRRDHPFASEPHGARSAQPPGGVRHRSGIRCRDASGRSCPPPTPHLIRGRRSFPPRTSHPLQHLPRRIAGPHLSWGVGHTIDGKAVRAATITVGHGIIQAEVTDLSRSRGSDVPTGSRRDGRA